MGETRVVGKGTDSHFAQWSHSPSHLFISGASYIVTAGTYLKERVFDTPARLTLVLETIFQQAENFGWQLQAWAMLQNHYHLVAHAPQDGETLKPMIQAIHSLTARAINAEDGAPGRKVWYQYRDTCLTNEKSYFARLNYVHNNPVKHGLVAAAENYRWCSMSWFLQMANPGFRRMVLSFPCDRISIDDDF